MQDPALFQRRISLLLLILALALAGFGQAILSFARDLALVGLAAYAASFLLFLELVRLARGAKSLTQAEAGLIALLGKVNQELGLQFLMVLVAAGAVFVANGIAQSSRPSDSYWPAFLAWLLGLVTLGVSLVYLPARSHLASLRDNLKQARIEIFVLFGLTAAGFALRAVSLSTVPYPFAGDEGSVGMEGLHILTGHITNMFVSGWSSEPMMSFLPYALTQAIFGPSIFGIRIFPVLVGTLTIPTVYLLARSMFNRPMALLSAVLLTVMSVHIHFSRIAVNNIENSFFACLVFWLVYRAVETRGVYWFAAAGIAGGASIYSYAGTRFVIIVAGIYLVYAFLTDRVLWKQWGKFFIFALCAGVVLFPIAVYFWQHPDIAFGRLNQVGVFQNGWIAQESARTQEPVPLVFARLVVNSFLVFISTPAIGGFWNSPLPLVDGAWAFFSVVGMIFSLLNLGERRQVLLQLWFWSVVITAGALTVPPPAAERLTMAFPAVAIFAAYGIWNVASFFGESLNARPIVAQGLMALAALLLTATSLNFYFREYTPKYYFADANSEVGMELGEYLATVPRTAKVYFMGEPRMFIGFPSIPFLSHNLDAVDVHPGDNISEMVEPGREAIFVALPNRYPDLEDLRALYPGGSVLQVFRRTNPGESLYTAYVVPDIPP